jgi:hypothetical protein
VSQITAVAVAVVRYGKLQVIGKACIPGSTVSKKAMRCRNLVMNRRQFLISRDVMFLISECFPVSQERVKRSHGLRPPHCMRCISDEPGLLCLTITRWEVSIEKKNGTCSRRCQIEIGRRTDGRSEERTSFIRSGEMIIISHQIYYRFFARRYQLSIRDSPISPSTEYQTNYRLGV